MLSSVFYRTYQEQNFTGSYALLVWGSLLLMGLVFVFRTKPIEAYLDREFFGGAPGTYFLRDFSFTLGLVLYSKVLRLVDPQFNHLHRWLDYFSMLILGILTYIFWASTQHQISAHQARYLMMTVMDFNALIYICLLCFPVNFFMFRREEIDVMRVKHFFTSLLCFAYGVTAFLTLIIGPIAVATGKVLFTVPLGPIGVVCICVQFMPHNKIIYLLQPEQVYHYYKIRNLERWIAARTNAVSVAGLWVNPFSISHTTSVIYTAMINIWDYYKLLPPEAAHVMEQIDQIMKTYPKDSDYHFLVKALARVEYE